MTFKSRCKQYFLPKVSFDIVCWLADIKWGPSMYYVIKIWDFLTPHPLPFFTDMRIWGGCTADWACC